MYTLSNMIRVKTGYDLVAKGFSPDQMIDVMYDLTASNEQERLLLESASLDEIDEWYNVGDIHELILEAITIKRYSQADGKLKALARVLDKHLPENIEVEKDEAGGYAVQVGKPKKTGSLFATVTAQIPFSDGQALSIIFHSPDGDKTKIAASDEIIAFRFLLNKRDITHVVSPEKGKDVSLDEISKRVTRIVAKTSEKFQAKQKAIQEQKAELVQVEADIEAATIQLDNEIKAAEKAKVDLAAIEPKVEAAKTQVEKLEKVVGEKEKRLAELQAQKTASEGKTHGSSTAPETNHPNEPTPAAPLEVTPESAPQPEATPGPETGRKTEYVDWFVNYTETQGTGRTTDVKRFATLKEARSFAIGKFGYITKTSDGASDWAADKKGKTVFVEYFGGFVPSAQESLSIEKLTGEPTPKTEIELSREEKQAIQKELYSLRQEAKTLGMGTEAEALYKAKDLEGLRSLVAGAQQAAPSETLPIGWTEATPGGLATNKDPLTGGIVDKEIVSGEWFVIPNNDKLDKMTGFQTRESALANFAISLNSLNGNLEFDPTDSQDYSKVLKSEALQLKYQDKLDAYFNERIIAVRNELRKIGVWSSASTGDKLVADKFEYSTKLKQVGGSKNIVGVTHVLSSAYDDFKPIEMIDMLKLPARGIAQMIENLKQDAYDSRSNSEIDAKTAQPEAGDDNLAYYIEKKANAKAREDAVSKAYDEMGADLGSLPDKVAKDIVSMVLFGENTNKSYVAKDSKGKPVILSSSDVEKVLIGNKTTLGKYDTISKLNAQRTGRSQALYVLFDKNDIKLGGVMINTPSSKDVLSGKNSVLLETLASGLKISDSRADAYQQPFKIEAMYSWVPEDGVGITTEFDKALASVPPEIPEKEEWLKQRQLQSEPQPEAIKPAANGFNPALLKKGYYIKRKRLGLGDRPSPWELVTNVLNDGFMVDDKKFVIPFSDADITHVRTGMPELGRGELIYGPETQPKSTPEAVEPVKSIGHIAFANGYEYYSVENGDIHRAPIANPIMSNGRRSGRFEATDAAKESLLRMLGVQSTPEAVQLQPEPEPQPEAPAAWQSGKVVDIHPMKGNHLDYFRRHFISYDGTEFSYEQDGLDFIIREWDSSKGKYWQQAEIERFRSADGLSSWLSSNQARLHPDMKTWGEPDNSEEPEVSAAEPEAVTLANDILSGKYDNLPPDEMADLVEPIYDLPEDQYGDLMDQVDAYTTELTKKAVANI